MEAAWEILKGNILTFNWGCFYSAGYFSSENLIFANVLDEEGNTNVPNNCQE
jgi:hypothetical protein